MKDNPVNRSWIRKGFGWSSFGLGLALIVCHEFQFDRLAPITLVPPWLWLVPGILLSVLAGRHHSKGLWIGTAAIWLVFAVRYVEESTSLLRRSRPQPVPAEQQSIRVVTLNCNVGNLNAIREIARWNPDVVLLQESPGRDRLNDIGKEIISGPFAVLDGGDAAILIGGEFRMQDANPSRHFVHAVAKLANGREIDIVSLRLSPPVFRIDFWETRFWTDHLETRQNHRKQLQAVRDYLDSEQMTPHLIIGGDFNMVGNDGAFEPFDELQDTFWQAGSGWCNTGTNDYPLFRVDQIWTTPNLRCLALGAFETEHSDHRMVVADLKFSGE